MPFTETPGQYLLGNRVQAGHRPSGPPDTSTTRAWAAGILPATLLVSLALGGSTAAAAPGVTCGSIVSADVTLTSDLSCPSGDGIILGSNVTLDLGGHSLVGGGAAVGVQTEFLSQGGNTIRNGTIENWATGILLQEQSPENVPYVISDVVLRQAPVSHYVGNTTLQLTQVTATDSPVEGQLGGHVSLSHSRLDRSPISVFFADATITGSTLVQSPVSATIGQVRIDSSRLDGRGTSALGSVSEGIITVTNSGVRNFAEPITGFWGGVVLTGNTFRDMPHGVLGDISSNIGSDGVSEIVGNTFTRSGVVLRGNVPMNVERNIFKHNEIGVEFTRSSLPGQAPLTADGSRAVGNVLMRNSGTGILTDLPGLAVGDNTAKKNGGYGISAPGAVDLGGNVAFGNALGDCVGVVCARR